MWTDLLTLHTALLSFSSIRLHTGRVDRAADVLLQLATGLRFESNDVVRALLRARDYS